jgi:hypothetical protein
VLSDDSALSDISLMNIVMRSSDLFMFVGNREETGWKTGICRNLYGTAMPEL